MLSAPAQLLELRTEDKIAFSQKIDVSQAELRCRDYILEERGGEKEGTSQGHKPDEFEKKEIVRTYRTKKWRTANQRGVSQ